MQKTLPMILMLLCLSAVSVSARTFVGNATIEVIEISPIILKVCSPNQKYIMAAGTSRILLLGVRNVMINKTVNRLDLDISADPALRFDYATKVIENLTPNEHQYFIINVTLPEEPSWHDYEITFLVGTDEYLVGAFQFPVLIKARPYARVMLYVASFGAVLLLFLVAARALAIFLINRKRRKEKCPKERSLSWKYYKK